MRKVLISISAMGLALAVPAQAFADEPAAVTCDINWDNWLNDGPGIRSALSRLITSRQASSWSSAAQIYQGQLRQNPYVTSRPACTTVSIEGVIMQKAGVTANTPLPAVSGQSIEVASPQLPANATNADYERQLADHERRITALEQRGAPVAVIEAERARGANIRVRAARRDRDNAAARLQQTATRPHNQAEIAALTTALQQAEGKLAEAEARLTAVEATAARAERLARDNNRRMNAVVGRDGRSGMLGQMDERLKAEEAATSAWWAVQWWWFAILLVLGALVTWWLASRKQEASAPTSVKVELPNVVTHEELGEKLKGYVTSEKHDQTAERLDGRIDRSVTEGDVQFDKATKKAIEQAKPGDEIDVGINVDGQSTYKGLRVKKLENGNFELLVDVGVSSPAGQDVGNVIKFVRLAHNKRPGDLELFLVSAA